MGDGRHIAITTAVICHGRLNIRAHIMPLVAPKGLIMMSKVIIMVHARGPSHAPLAVHSVTWFFRRLACWARFSRGWGTQLVLSTGLSQKRP